MLDGRNARGLCPHAIIPLQYICSQNLGFVMIVSCGYCAKTFTAKMQRRVFCSDRCRTRYNRENVLTCWYCGDMADTRDHVTPHSTTGFKKRSWSNLDYVMCCKECNHILGSNFPYDMLGRIEYLIQKFTRKHKLNKEVIQWDEEELDEVGHNLSSYIRASMIAWNKKKDRLSHMRLRRALIINSIESDCGCDDGCGHCKDFT